MTDKPFTITNIGTNPASVKIVRNKTSITYAEYLGNYVMVSFDNRHFTKYESDFDIKVEPKSSLYIKISKGYHITFEDKIIDNIQIRNSKVVLSGNINSLLSPNKYLDPSAKLPHAAFKDLFYDPILFTDICNESIVSAEDLEMPALKLSNYAYHRMFLNCKKLIHPPKVLPAKNIKSFTYADMFKGCINLQEIPDIKAETLIGRSCSDMFANCTSLKNISNFPRKLKKIESNSCDRMFYGCTNLNVLPSEININKAEGYIGIKMFDKIAYDYNYPMLSTNHKHISSGAYFRMFSRGVSNRKYPMSVFSRGRYIW